MPISAFETEKKDLRARARRQRAEFLSLETAELDGYSTKLSATFHTLMAERKWEHIAVFIPLAGEPDIWSPAQQFLDSGSATLYVPRMMPENQLDLVMITNLQGLIRGPFGVIQPPPDWDSLADLRVLDAIFIPGLAFSPGGGRLGFGGGWYDRLLARIPESTIKIGVCWNEMLVDAVPMDAWDVRVDGILTEAGYVTSSRNNH